MKKLFITITLITLGIGNTALAASTYISNSVSSSASTGGNSAGSGQTVEGQSTVSASVKTTVNGEVIEDVKETINASAGGELKIEKSYSTTSPGSSIKTKLFLKSYTGTSSVKVDKEAALASSSEFRGLEEKIISIRAMVSQILEHVLSFFRFK